MTLDMANGDASSILVSFYLVATNESGSNARTSAIHRVKCNVPLSGDKPNDQSNTVKYLIIVIIFSIASFPYGPKTLYRCQTISNTI